MTKEQEAAGSLKEKILVIGASGFVGGHLLRYLSSDATLDVYATGYHKEIQNFPSVKILSLDILSASDTEHLLQEVLPDTVFLLAAQSSVALSFQYPELTMNVNVIGSLHVMEAIRRVCPESTFLLTGSSEEYGAVKEEMMPIRETARLEPKSPYAISKVASEAMAMLYAQSYGLKFIMVRAFNHIGPGQSPQFVVSDFAKQIAMIEKGMSEPVLYVGNLSACRDFTDARDIVRGYRLLTKYGRPGEVYNIGTGKSISVRHVLDLLLAESKIPIEVTVDQAKYRPVDIPDIRADIRKIHADTKWYPQIPVETSIRDSLDYWRQHIE